MTKDDAMSGSAPIADVEPGGEESSLRSRGLDLSLMRDPNVGVLLVSRMATKLGLATLSYGGMVFLARSGAPQWQVSLVGAVGFISAFGFGLQGGLIADSMPKRMALVAGYAAQAALCFLVPTFFGVNLGALLFLTFAVSMIGQVVSPASKAAVAIVASAAALASVGALITVAGGIGSAFGSAFLAPLLIKLFDIRAVMYTAGVILAFGAIRALKLPKAESGVPIRDSLRGIDWRLQLPTPRQTATWILSLRAVTSMVLVGAIVVALFEALTSLLPVYVRDVLDADPANSIYIFAPAGLGYLIGMAGGPWLMDRIGERRLALIALGFMAVGAMLYGFVDLIAPVIAPFSPLRLLGLFGINLSDAVLAAGVISIPTNFGSTAAGAAVLTYINRRVPVAQQGGVFGMQEVIENGLTIVALLSLGIVATWLGSKVVFIVAPPLIIAFVVWLVRYSYKAGQRSVPTRRQALGELLERADPHETTVADGTRDDRAGQLPGKLQ